MTTQYSIRIARAHLDDPDDIAHLLAQVPNSEGLGALLRARGQVSTRAYEDETETARFVRSDGLHVICMAVAGVTIDEAEMIAAQCELLDEWNDAQLGRAVHLALADDDEPSVG